ncbi:ATPase [Spirochaetia bacterium]|nr:ATPase [Spirochaetia bacterium]
MYQKRYLEREIHKGLKTVPVVAVTGPRQCGKSTLVKELIRTIPKTLYLDLERPSDMRKLENAEWFFMSQKQNLICIDEVQRKPELFPLIRSLVDEWNRPGCFLILGSAARDLLKQSSESLAGRISYKRLTPFLFDELPDTYTIEHYFTAGAFPRSIMAVNRDSSFQWREDFITTFLERDLLQWSAFSPAAMGRLWRMLAHLNGSTANYSGLGSSINRSSAITKSYIDLLASTYMLELVPPYFSNLGKRLVKAPKIYIADSGICAALLGLRSFEEISGHPAFGSLWEQLVLSHIRGWYPGAELFYYRTSNGAEMDFVVKLGQNTFAIECKASYSPVLSKGNYLAMEDINPKHMFVVIPPGPQSQSWSMKRGIDVVSLPDLKKRLIR